MSKVDSGKRGRPRPHVPSRFSKYSRTKGSALLLAVAGGLLGINALGAGSEAIIKQRAKELSNQNNVRQGVAPPAQAPTPAAPNAAQPVLTPQQRLQADFVGIKVNSQVTADQKQRLARDLMALAQGTPKPSFARTQKLAEELSAALVQKSLSDGTRSRLLQDLTAALNPANIPATQMQDVIADIQAIFQSNGLPRKEAVAIADEVKGIGAELQKTAGK